MNLSSGGERKVKGGWIELAMGGRVKFCRGEEEHNLVKSDMCLEAGECGYCGTGLRGDKTLSCTKRE